MKGEPLKATQLNGDIAVLLVNLGTPDAPTAAALRRYLREFLSDPRVIEVPRALWWFLLRAFILPFRPRKSAAAYAAIWDRETDESPLRKRTRGLCESLSPRFDPTGLRFDWAMRYGSPSIDERLRALVDTGVRRILLWPLYPQYSASTTASVMDAALASLRSMRTQPSLRTVPPYYDDPAYIDALARSTERSLAQLGWEPDLLLLSFHGLPEKYIERGDPYLEHCRRTAELLREALGLPAERSLSLFSPASDLHAGSSPKPIAASQLCPARGSAKSRFSPRASQRTASRLSKSWACADGRPSSPLGGATSDSCPA